MSTLYDELVYEHFPIEAMHIDHVAAVAQLCGLKTKPVHRCRVLELGCGTGGHLIPMAASLPESEFVGVDLSSVQIARARELAGRLGLQNIRFEVGDVQQMSGSGDFDQVLAHGLYSWVPEGVRLAVMRVVQESLAPGGVACVSYGVLPGCHGRLALRDMLRWNDDPSKSPAERAGDAAFFAATLSQELTGPMSDVLRRLIGELGGMSDSYVLFDFLSEHSHPMTVSDFVAHAGKHRLRYVGDAHSYVEVGTGDRVSAAQREDFRTQRAFRSSLLCHEDQLVDDPLKGRALDGLWLTTAAVPRGQEEGRAWFRAPGRPEFGVSESLGAVLEQLVEAGPRPVPMEELPAEMADHLVALARGGHVDVATCDRGIGGVVGFPVARDQVIQGETSVTNLWHRTVALDRDQIALLPLLDGTRSDDALLDEVRVTLPGADAAWLARVRDGLRRAALLTTVDAHGAAEAVARGTT